VRRVNEVTGPRTNDLTALWPLVVEGKPSQGLNLFTCIDLCIGGIEHVAALVIDLGLPRAATALIAPRKKKGNHNQRR
jgi:hypothetical protein